MIKEPRFTLFYNTTAPYTPYIGVAYEFYDDEKLAKEAYKARSQANQCPTLRRYHRNADSQYFRGMK